MPSQPIEVKASTITRISTVSEIIAARCRKNRRRTSCAWVRATMANPWAWVLEPAGTCASVGSVPTGGLESVLMPPPFRGTSHARSPRNGCRHHGVDCSTLLAAGARPGYAGADFDLGEPRSCQPNPRIEEPVDDVGRQVGQHDRKA